MMHMPMGQEQSRRWPMHTGARLPICRFGKEYQDAVVMNLDDLLCVGVTDNILLSSTIGRNKNLIPGEVISAIVEGNRSIFARRCKNMVST